MAERFREAGIFATAPDAASVRMSESLRASGALRGTRNLITTQMSDSFRKGLLDSSKARTAALEEAVHGLRAPPLPKLDVSKLAAAPTAPTKLGLTPARSVPDVGALTETVERLIDVAEKQAAATIAAEAASDARHDESERRADERAARADNRDTWAIAVAVATFLLVVVVEVFR